MSLNILEQIEKQLNPQKVGVVEFAESSEYCNRPLYPRQRMLLKTFFLEELEDDEEDELNKFLAGGRSGSEIIVSPNIRDRTEWLRSEGYSHFKEIIIPAGRRSSKGYITAIAMAKIMYDTLQLQDPGAYYGIDPTKDIQFACIAAAEQQAKEMQFGDLASTIEGCRAFEPYLVKSLETEIRIATETDLRQIAKAKMTGNKIQKDIARLRGKALAANASTVRGSASMVICMDEIAWMQEGESKSSAIAVYKAAKPSLAQFGRDSMIFLNSSPYTKVGLFYDRYTSALVPFDKNRGIDELEFVADDEEGSFEMTNGDPRIATFQYPSWALYEGYKKAKYYKFKEVVQASPDWDEHEEDWSDGDILKIKEARAEEGRNPETYRVEYRGKFAEVIDAFLSPVKVDQMFKGLPDTLIYEHGSDRPVYTYKKLKTNMGGGALYSYRYKFHVDPSTTTAGFGFAIAHTEMFDAPLGATEEHVVFDLLKRWLPKDFDGSVIKWRPILDEIMMLADMFRPFEITFDQHQSAQPIQELDEKLKARNIQTRVYEKPATNELNWKRWETFKTVLYQGLVHAPDDTVDAQWAAQELKFLQQENTGGKYPRVEKQEIGPVQTKDIADCVSECVYTLLGNQYMNRAMEQLSRTSLYGGAPGGYGIGYSGVEHRPEGSPTPDRISDYYQHKQSLRNDYNNPARGILGRGHGRSSRRSRY